MKVHFSQKQTYFRRLKKYVFFPNLSRLARFKARARESKVKISNFVYFVKIAIACSNNQTIKQYYSYI